MTSASRRALLKALAAAPLALRLPAAAAAPSNRLLVLVFLYGGNDNFNTWVPFADSLYYRLRPTIAVPRDAVLKITESHGFHPSLRALIPAWEARELALVQGIGYPDATQQHYRDIEMAFTAVDGNEFRREGWVSRALAPKAAGLDAVAFDVLDIRDADPMGPFRGDKLGVVQVHYAHELLARGRIADCVIEPNSTGRARVNGLARYDAPALRTAFPTDPFGQAVRAAVELAATDRALPVIHIALNGVDGDKHHSVDTHWNQLKYHGDALERLARGLASLREGLREIGRWDETLVATYDEFGRSPVENEARGTHHGHGSVHFVMGGRVRGGLVGEPPRVVRVHQVGGPEPTLDARRLWTTVIEGWWSAKADGVFARAYRPLEILRA